MKHASGTWFPGLTLSDSDRVQVAEIRRLGTLRARDWRRLQMLELLDSGLTLSAVGRALGTHAREVRRVGWRYLERGLEAALADEPRYIPEPLLDHREESALVAMVCSAPPEGLARWTVRLIASEAIRRGVVKRVGRETVRLVLERHDLKPWREKNVVRSEARRGVHRANGGRLEHAGPTARSDSAGRGA